MPVTACFLALFSRLLHAPPVAAPPPEPRKVLEPSKRAATRYVGGEMRRLTKELVVGTSADDNASQVPTLGASAGAGAVAEPPPLPAPQSASAAAASASSAPPSSPGGIRGAEASASVALCFRGLGGAGKTEAALQYFYAPEATSLYPAGAFWLAASDDAALRADLRRMAVRALSVLSDATAADARDVLDAVTAWLGSHDGWLLVLDNVDAAAALRRARARPRHPHLARVP